MKGLVKKLKRTSGSSSIEIIIWFSIVMILFTIVFCIHVGSKDNKILNENPSNIISHESISDNQNDIVKEEYKAPITQHITINNIKNDKDNNLLHDFNINLLSDLTSTILIALSGFFIGKFTKKKKVSLKKN